MRVNVRLFASLREAFGRDLVELELPAGATADAAWGALVAEQSSLAARRARLTVAINRRYGRFADELHDGDELVFVPPVSGG